MATSDPACFARLEDFIAFAKTGANIHASVALEKQLVTQRHSQLKSEKMEKEQAMYILSAIFTFQMGSGDITVSKVYLFGSTGESAHESRVHINIVNARLTVDYKRLSDANIAIDEKFF